MITVKISDKQFTKQLEILKESQRNAARLGRFAIKQAVYGAKVDTKRILQPVFNVGAVTQERGSTSSSGSDSVKDTKRKRRVAVSSRLKLKWNIFQKLQRSDDYKADFTLARTPEPVAKLKTKVRKITDRQGKPNVKVSLAVPGFQQESVGFILDHKRKTLNKTEGMSVVSRDASPRFPLHRVLGPSAQEIASQRGGNELLQTNAQHRLLKRVEGNIGGYIIRGIGSK
jgi:hypothetical protein